MCIRDRAHGAPQHEDLALPVRQAVQHLHDVLERLPVQGALLRARLQRGAVRELRHDLRAAAHGPPAGVGDLVGRDAVHEREERAGLVAVLGQRGHHRQADLLGDVVGGDQRALAAAHAGAAVAQHQRLDPRQQLLHGSSVAREGLVDDVDQLGLDEPLGAHGGGGGPRDQPDVGPTDRGVVAVRAGAEVDTAAHERWVDHPATSSLQASRHCPAHRRGVPRRAADTASRKADHEDGSEGSIGTRTGAPVDRSA